MNVLIFSVFDSAAQGFLQPFFFSMPGQAIRAFSDAINNPTHEFAKHPQDYTLFQIGSYDSLTAELTPSVPVSLGNALQFKDGVS